MLKNEKFRDIIFDKSEHKIYSVKYIIVELFKHQDRILKYSSLSEEDLLTFFHNILNHIHFVDDSLISPENLKKAHDLCKDIDEKDTLYVALTLELDGLLWSGDKELKSGLKKKGIDFFYEP